jgi:meromycolic acid enoyl-[acyl-carrier-protein] reductase
MLLEGKRIMVMGLMDTASIAWAVGQRAASLGADVIYTVQNERFRDVFLRRSFQKENLNLDDYQIVPCDVASDEDLERTFGDESMRLDGLVHCIGYAKPDTCLAENLMSAPRKDVMYALEVSAASLAFAVGAARPRLREHASVVSFTFASDMVFPHYNWMGVCKAALEATARYLARDLGPSGIRVNCISAGPQDTRAATHIPAFGHMARVWPARVPLGWDVGSRSWVADSAMYLLSDLSRGVTAEVLHVDGGFHAMGMEIAPKAPEG